MKILAVIMVAAMLISAGCKRENPDVTEFTTPAETSAPLPPSSPSRPLELIGYRLDEDTQPFVIITDWEESDGKYLYENTIITLETEETGLFLSWYDTNRAEIIYREEVYWRQEGTTLGFMLDYPNRDIYYTEFIS
jgi:hypothetical protein